jgi:hypothetical protein
MDDHLRNLPDDKVRRERCLLDAVVFHRLCATRDGLDVTYRDAPDFLLRRDSMVLGVEIAELHWDEGRRGSKYRAAAARIASLNKRIPEAAPGTYAVLHGEVDNIAALREDLVVDQVRHATGSTLRLNNDVKVDLLRGESHSGAWWPGLKAGEIASVARALNRRVEEKRAQAAAYERCDILWLLICAIPNQLASYMFESGDELRIGDISPFDEVLLFDAFSETLWRVGPDPVAVANEDDLHRRRFGEAIRSFLWPEPTREDSRA